MNSYLDKSEQEIAMEFFKAPTGTVLCERGAYFQSAIYAVKLPLGNDSRVSMVLAERLPKNYFNETGAYPPADWKLALDSYVDNETGRRVICTSYSQFAQILDYREGIQLKRAYSEVEAAVRKQILATPEETLRRIACREGKDPASALVIRDWERKQLRADCERGFVFDTKPDPYARFLKDLAVERLVPNAAQFAISYLKGKDQLVQKLTDQLIPKYAVDVIHQRAMEQEMKCYMEELANKATPLLRKEQCIRRAIRGKASVWATFTMEGQFLRISIPTALFHSTSRELNKFALPDKDRKRLQMFLEQSTSNGMWTVCIEQIVALDYRGRLLYRDEEFYRAKNA